MKLLILDSDPAARTTVPASFSGSIFDVTLCANFEETFFALQQEAFAIILVFIEEPDSSVIPFIQSVLQQYPALSPAFLVNAVHPDLERATAPFTTMPLIEKSLTPQKLVNAIHASHQTSAPLAEPPPREIPSSTDQDIISNFKLVDVIQMCCLSQKTGLLKARGGDLNGSIYFQSGKIYHAETEDIQGEVAFYEIVALENPTFVFTDGSTKTQNTITLGWEHLLLEGARLKDEREKKENVTVSPIEINMEELAGRTIGPYQIIQKMAADEWGFLYEAVQVAVSRTVAIKILDPTLYGDQGKVHEFTSFASTMARAQNPYITVVYEAGKEDGFIFYTREYIAGGNLKDRLQQNQVIPEGLALRILMNISEALCYEKRLQIPHIPLVMEQILIPDTGEPKLLNNVSLTVKTQSAGEMDEIRRLGLIIKQAVQKNPSISPEFKNLVARFENAGQASGFNHWNIALQATQQLNLDLRAKQVTRPRSAIISQPVKKSSVIKPWMHWLGASLTGLLAISAAWFFFQTPGARDIGTMIAIPAGPFTYQSNQQISLPAFYIDKYEVTIGQYRNFLDAWNQNKASIVEHPSRNSPKDHTPDNWAQINPASRQGAALNGVKIYNNTPIFNIDYYDAWAYAKWAGKRLPTEQEWEKAARGPSGKIYPWGSTFDSKNTNIGGNHKWTPVGSISKDCSDYGVMDMAGNLSEWTDSWDKHPDFSEQVPVVRGGSWNSSDARLTYRDVREPKSQRRPWLGFRCASGNPPASNK